MEALDLTKRPPRSPREMTGGLYMLGRTIDKMRALIPGGNIGEYRLPGFTTRLLEALGIDPEEMTAVVRDAKDEEEVVRWVHAHSNPEIDYGKLNDSMARRSRAHITDAEHLARFENTYGSQVPMEKLLFDVMEDDDRAMFRVSS